jgi:hypothetical protein
MFCHARIPIESLSIRAILAAIRQPDALPGAFLVDYRSTRPMNHADMARLDCQTLFPESLREVVDEVSLNDSDLSLSLQ